MTTALLAPWLSGLLLSYAIEALLRPAVAPPWRRSVASHGVHLGSWCLLFALFLLAVQRPWFAVVFILSLQLVVVQSSNTKSATLKEPFICQDFEYFLDAIKHPRLYVPFFGIGLAIAASSAGALAIAAFLWFEPSLAGQGGTAALLVPVGLLLAAAGALLALSLGRLPPCTLAPQQDLHRLGLFAALWHYGLLALRPPPESAQATPFADAPKEAPPREQLPHLVVVQSESFFDPRSWVPELPDTLLPHFDALARDALCQGPLSVPAWGANTVRTEAAFLTGQPPEALGIHRFTPYRQFTRAPVASLASQLRALGYRTVCVHPYPAGFYLRHRVFPNLGFDEFLDIRHFGTVDRDGQYVGDLAVAEKVGTLLDDSDNGPLFVFAITMENHGPLHLERPVPEDAPALPPAVAERLTPEAAADLRVYLRHLGNADAMLGRLRERLTPATPGARHGMLCWYGDHVPIMSVAYRRLGEPSGDTCYALWSSRQPPRAGGAAAPLAASELGKITLAALLRDAACVANPNIYHQNNAVGQTQSHQEQE